MHAGEGAYIKAKKRSGEGPATCFRPSTCHAVGYELGLLDENTVDAAKKKHVPVITNVDRWFAG